MTNLDSALIQGDRLAIGSVMQVARSAIGRNGAFRRSPIAAHRGPFPGLRGVGQGPCQVTGMDALVTVPSSAKAATHPHVLKRWRHGSMPERMGVRGSMVPCTYPCR